MIPTLRMFVPYNYCIDRGYWQSFHCKIIYNWVGIVVHDTSMIQWINDSIEWVCQYYCYHHLLLLSL